MLRQIVLLICVIGPAARAAAVDVIVYGGTAGGVMAAVAAEREGASVVLLEPGRHLGGMVSGGLGWGDVNRPEIVGGYAREFFTRVGKHYGKQGMVWHIEPHVAERIFGEMAAEARVTIQRSARLRDRDGVKMSGGRIVEVTTEGGDVFAAKVFVDASYEGDLMAAAGVTFRVGREGTSEYGEPSAGVRKLQPSGRAGVAVDAIGVLPLVCEGAAGTLGDADEKVQCYNYRLCLTKRAENRVTIEKPTNYDPRDYTLIARALEKMPSPTLAQLLTISPLPNDKTDINNGAFVSTDLPNANWSYPHGSYADRERIARRHRDYTLGLLWFFANDSRVPESLRKEAKEWGLAKDEFVDSENFPHQLYIREARRMVGDYVMSEKDARSDNEKADAIAIGSYMLDCHPVQRVLMPDNDFANEGYIGGNHRVLPYEIPYRALTPKRDECVNLLVPVCMSATHVAWASIRMEPQFMLMGHAAGVAAAMAARDGASVQDVSTDALRAKLTSQGQVLRWKLPGVIDVKTLAGTVMDDDQAAYTGPWQTSNSLGPLVGNSFHIGVRDGQKRTARFAPELAGGKYEVRMFYAAASTRAKDVTVTVHHAGGDSIVTIDQTRAMPNDGAVLGTFDFATGKQGWVEIATDGMSGAVIVDALQWLSIR